MMLKFPVSAFRRRRAVSTMIGGVIVLSLLLTALGTTVFVSQQYDQYQQTANKMAQLRNQQLSEYLVVNSPGLAWVTSAGSWGSGCGTTYACYNATLSNLGGVGVQVVRVYINSTGPAGSGCVYSTSYPNLPPCILNPSPAITSYAFNQANAFINPGETNHALLLALPYALSLPTPSPGYPENTILIVTSRGNLFSFQWPFQPQIFGQSQSAFSSGIMKVAYTGTGTGTFDSKNEPGLGGSGGTGYCHQETAQSYPAGIGYAEKLGSSSNPIPGLPSTDNGVLWFVNPWITGNGGGSGYNDVLDSVVSGATTLYIYVIIINTGTTAYSPTAGTIDLTWYGSNHFDGNLIGVYYNSIFYATSPSIASGASYYAIYKITTVMLGSPPGGGSPQTPAQSTMFWGAASITDASGSSNENRNFFAGTILLSGLWIRYEALSGSCA